MARSGGARRSVHPVLLGTGRQGFLGTRANAGNFKFLLLKSLMFLQATKSIIPLQTSPEHQTHSGLGILMRTFILIVFLLLFGFAATVKNVPDFFFSPPES